MHLPGLKQEEEVSEEGETAGKMYSLAGVQGDWEIHHFSSAVGATWKGQRGTGVTQESWNSVHQA